MTWYLIDYNYAGDNWRFDVQATSEHKAIEIFKATEVYQGGHCTIKSISIMTPNQARIAQKNNDRIMSNRKSYEERLKELENEDEEFKQTALYRRLKQLYRERMSEKID